MPRLSWSTFRDRWQVFIGAIVTVALGVALVQSSLLTLISTTTAKVPAGLPSAEDHRLREGLDASLALLGNTLGLATFVAVFIVSSTFAFTVAQRHRELALLRLVGASRRQVRRLLFGEALLLGLVGSALGVAAGLPVIRLQVWMLVRLDLLPDGFTTAWRSWIVGASIGAGVLISVCGVAAASGRAAKARPLAALREPGGDARLMTVPRWLLGVVFLAGGIALLVLVPNVGPHPAIAMALSSVMVLVVAVAAFTPLLLPAASWLPRLFAVGPLGQLAHANLRADARRGAATAAPVIVLFAFVVGLAGSLATLGAASRHETATGLRADLVVTAKAELTAQLAAVPGVATVSGPDFLLPAGLGVGHADPRRFSIQVTPGTAPATVAAALRTAALRTAGLGPDATVDTAAGWVRREATEAQRVNTDVMVGLLALAMVYTVVAMVNAVVVASASRDGEFATARLSGLTRGQVIRMALWEATSIVGVGAFLGGLTASATIFSLVTAVRHMIGVTIVSVPWPLTGAVALGSLAVVATTSVITALAATRTPAVRLAGTRE
jgi:putative ABC transport system permease protein